MSINIDGLSAKELSTLITQASQRKKKLQKRKPAAGIRRQINAILKKAGYTIAELFGGASPAKADKPAKPAKRAARKSTKAGSKVAPKYRNPANHAETWAARGKQPRWLTAEIAKGKKLEDFAIK
ncbi:MAG TPA: H-NS histone family protein [Xanthomonadaceae bacterium]|jgi:DNA-binding protein H-NS|nr:H-NS histone family protein [Xanthomonadaceae bacterium]